MKILLLAHTLHYTFATPYRYPLPINVVTPNHSVQPPKSKSRAPCNRGARFLWGFMAGAIFMCSGVNRKRIELTGSRAQLRGVRCDRGFWSFSLLRSSMVPREKKCRTHGGIRHCIKRFGSGHFDGLFRAFGHALFAADAFIFVHIVNLFQFAGNGLNGAYFSADSAPNAELGIYLRFLTHARQ